MPVHIRPRQKVRSLTGSQPGSRGWGSCGWGSRLGAFALLSLAGGASGQLIDTDAVLDMTGMEIRCVGTIFSCNFLDQARDSFNNPLPVGQPNGIVAADGYRYTIAGTVQSSGLLANFVNDGDTFASLLEFFDPGQSVLLDGYTRNISGGLPDPENNIFIQRFEGEFLGGINIGITLNVSISDQGRGAFRLENIDVPLGSLVGSVEVDQGAVTIETWQPPAPIETEWRMNGDLSAAFGPSSLRYMDDPAFGDVLRFDGTNDVPDATIPTGVTAAQSSFATTTSLGIAGPGGEEDTVYITSPARNLADENNVDWYRGVGLHLWPNNRPDFPGGFLGQWSIVMDVYVPASSWTADTNGGYVLSLVQDNHNNEDEGELYLRNPAFGGGGNIGYDTEPADYLSSPLFGPDRWMRIAFVSDLMQSSEGRVYVDGQFIGTTGGDWVFNLTDATDLRYADGEPIDPADWAAWGEHPSPWALTANNGTTKGGFSLFSDGLFGRSETAYVANVLFTDTLLDAADLAALGSAQAGGIRIAEPVCPGDVADDFGFAGSDGQVSFGDFLFALTVLGPCPGGTPGCAFDLADDFGFEGSDGQVSFGDFLFALTVLGPCP